MNKFKNLITIKLNKLLFLLIFNQLIALILKIYD